MWLEQRVSLPITPGRSTSLDSAVNQEGDKFVVLLFGSFLIDDTI